MFKNEDLEKLLVKYTTQGNLPEKASSTSTTGTRFLTTYSTNSTERFLVTRHKGIKWERKASLPDVQMMHEAAYNFIKFYRKGIK